MDRQLAEALRDGVVPGFVSKTWLSDGPTRGGFYLFQDRADADRYLEGMFTQDITNNRAFSDVRVERYDINQAMSAMTNGLGTLAVRARE